jgi:hypothetical protein
MGLAVSVFHLLDVIANDGSKEAIKHVRTAFRRINEALARQGFPPHNEPESRPEGAICRAHVGSFPVEYLRHLRLFYENARRHRGEPEAYPLIPRRTDTQIEQAESWIADRLEYWFSDNLLVHSIHEGYFVPMPTDEPILGEVPGGFLGSTNGLLAELVFMAPQLGIKLRKGRLSDREHGKLWSACNDRNERWMFEKVAWLTLFENARVSLEYGTAVVFH